MAKIVVGNGMIGSYAGYEELSVVRPTYIRGDVPKINMCFGV